MGCALALLGFWIGIVVKWQARTDLGRTQLLGMREARKAASSDLSVLKFLECLGCQTKGVRIDEETRSVILCACV